jgi:curved DNA-binding protein CbpA
MKWTDLEKKYLARLELTENAQAENIKTAYRRLIKQYHPELFIKDDKKYALAAEISKGLNEAYEYFEKKFGL